ncbi:GGDEF domain-containing response regulator [Cognaticolwellia mytili]|uniref:GGDEF domain-containing response regulator n=1 Tax=Cognaticolwellia mytili TaxID=1888913 RepID=UPI000A16E6BB|nr:diguanylate cyclase [Cognaticolwellia mytili]
MNILVVDDSSYQCQLIIAMIEDSGFKAVCANGYKEALELLKENSVDLILMDIEMPDMNGFELTKIIRSTYPEWMPIIFLSANDSEVYLAKGIDAGGDDYLTKPVKQVVLAAKIRAMERISLMKSALDRVNKQLELLSCIDPLTQLLNRRGIDSMLNNLWKDNIEQKAELSLMMLDIDCFKLYNDNYGHQKGDDCLAQVSNIFNHALDQSNGVIGRYGGEEFIIALPCTPIASARFKAQEIINVLLAAKIEHQYSTVLPYVSVSIGISSTCTGAANIEALIKQADGALYQAKANKKNQYAVFNSIDTNT